MSGTKLPTIVLGGTGYVSGELLRLIAGHPQLELRAVLSDSHPGEGIAKFFPHLAPIYSTMSFSSLVMLGFSLLTWCSVLTRCRGPGGYGPHGPSP